MTSDPGVTRQDNDYATQIQEVLDELQQMQEAPRVVTNPEELDTLERELRGRTDRLSSLLLGLHLQHSLDCEDLKVEQDLLSGPGRLRTTGGSRCGCEPPGDMACRCG
jgi:hypothetical protein